MEEFYKEICEAVTIEEEKAVCKKYNKPYSDVRICIDRAMKSHMNSLSNDRAVFHQMIVSSLKENLL